MNQILSLREKRAQAWDAAKAFLDEKRGSDGLISAEDAATYDRMEAEVVNLGNSILKIQHNRIRFVNIWIFDQSRLLCI